MACWKKIWSREYSVQYSQIAILSSLKPAEPILGGFLEEVAMAPEGPGVQACFAKDDAGWDGLMSSVANTHLKNQKTFSHFKKEFHALGKKYLDSAKFLSQSAKTKSGTELCLVYQTYFSDWLDYTASLWAAYLLNDHASNKAEALLAEKLGAEKGAALAAKVLQPSKPTEITRAIHLLSELKETRKSNAAETFLHEYPWYSCLDLQHPTWTVSDAKSAIQSAAPVPSLEPVNVSRLLRGIPLTDSERFLLESAHELSFIKDQRDVYRRKGVYLSQPFYAAVGKPLGQSFADLAYWTFEEVREFLNGHCEVPLSEVKKRKSGFLLYNGAEGMVCVSGNQVKPHLKKLGIVMQKEKVARVVHGLVGNRGKVQGCARVVRTVSDLSKVQKGDVMVAITTHPDFVPAMHRACAIVTDEGGLTSHAAIVSREFNIPCIVGTKNATSWFRDGDWIEVDAKLGIVKKIR